MTQSASQESELIKYYLSKFSPKNFLNKSEEIKIGRRIKSVEQEILKTSLKYQCFKDQLLGLNDAINRNKTIVHKYSKNITEESPSEEILAHVDMFRKLFKLLESDSSVMPVIKKINFTSSTIYHLISNIKNIYKAIKENQDIKAKSFKFFEINNDQEYAQLALDCTDSLKLNVLAKSLFCEKSVILKKLNELERIVKFEKTNKLTDEKLKDISGFIAEVGVLEEKFSKDRQTLIEANLPLVVNRAKKFVNSGLDLEDLIQEGNIGLMKAIDKYDPDRDVKVSTYATWWIDQAVRRAMSNKAKLVRIPVHIQRNLTRIHTAFFVLSQRLQREPTQREITAETGIPEEELIRLSATALHEVSIDTEVANGQSYCDVLYDAENTPFKFTSDNVMRAAVQAAISELTPREQIAIKLRYGLGIEREHTFEEVGAVLKVTKARAMQLDKNSVKKLFTNKDMLFYNRED